MQSHQGSLDVRPRVRGSHCIHGALGQCEGISMRNQEEKKKGAITLGNIPATLEVTF